MSSLARRLVVALYAVPLWIACAPTAPPPAAPAGPAASAPAAPEPTRAERRALRARGMRAYNQKDFASCASLLDQAHDRYGAACCHAQAGARDAAFAALDRAIDDGLRDQTPEDLEHDSDLAPLHADPRWQPAL